MSSRSKAALVATVVTLVVVLGSVDPSGAIPVGQFATTVQSGVTPGYPAASHPRNVTVGPDQLVWFTDSTSVNRINADGSVSHFDAVATFGANPSILSITTGPDGNLWFTKFNPPGQIGKITPAGVMTQVTSFASGNVEDIIPGPDGNLWFTRPFVSGGGTVGKITTGGTVTEAVPGLWAEPQPRFLAVGSDGNIWFTDDGGPLDGHVGRVARVTTGLAFTLVATSGVTAGFGAGFFPYPLTLGPDGNIWTAMVSTGGGAVARVTPAGVFTEFATPGLADLQDIVTVCGNLFISQQAEDDSTASIYRLTTGGTFTQFTAGLPATASPQGLGVGLNQILEIAAGGDPGGFVLTMGTGCQPDPTSTTGPTATVAPVVRATPRFTG